MEAETQHYLGEVKRVRNHAANGELQVKAKRYLKHHEQQQRRDELDSIAATLSPNNFANRDVSGEGRALLMKRKRVLEKQLQEESPPTDLSGSTRDALARRQAELEENIRVGMPTVEEMRRNPPGAVDKHRAWEKKQKAAILERANIIRLLRPDDDSKDITNIDMIRPTQFIPGGPTTFMPDAQIGGQMSYAHIPDEKWEAAGLPLVNENSPMAAAEKRELEELRAMKAEIDAKRAVKAAAFKERMQKGRERAAATKE